LVVYCILYDVTSVRCICLNVTMHRRSTHFYQSFPSSSYCRYHYRTICRNSVNDDGYIAKKYVPYCLLHLPCERWRHYSRDIDSRCWCIMHNLIRLCCIIFIINDWYWSLTCCIYLIIFLRYITEQAVPISNFVQRLSPSRSYFPRVRLWWRWTHRLLRVYIVSICHLEQVNQGWET